MEQQMAIQNDGDLARCVAQASDLVAQIQDYCGKTLREDSKIKFPRGLIGTAESYRGRCPGYLSPDQISSCAYAFMYLDVLWWLLSRTDISSVARQMALKSAIVTIATVTETCLYLPGYPRTDVLSKKSEAGVKRRLEEAVGRGWISEPERTVLEQLWDHRNNIHLKFLENSERDIYKVEHVNAPLAALLTLMNNAKAWHVKKQSEAEAKQ